MKHFTAALIFCSLVFSGCGSGSSSGDDDGSRSNMEFDLISSTDTLSGGVGHYSLTYQANKNSDGKPVSGLELDTVTYTLYENDFELAESKLRIEKNPKNVANHIMLVLDFSGSVVGDCVGITVESGTINNPYTDDSNNLCTQLVNSATQFINTVVKDNQKLALYYFNARSNIFPLVEHPTNNKTQLIEGMQLLFSQEFRDTNLKGYESTNLYGAVVEASKIACQWVDNCNYGPYRPGVQSNPDLTKIASIVIFTDGRELAMRVTERDMLDMIDRHQDNFYYSIGLGNVDDAIMNRIGKDGFFKVEDVTDLNSAFDELGVGLEDWANSFYKVDFCPTQQSGESRVVLKVSDETRNLYGELATTITLPNSIDLRCDL